MIVLRNKILIAHITAMLMLILSAAVVSAADIHYYLRPDSFDSMGTWIAESATGAFGDILLKGKVDRKPETAQPAVVSFDVSHGGDYAVWARTRDFDTFPGQRTFKIKINGELQSFDFGAHGFNGWKWESGFVITLSEGQNVLELIDSSAYYARVDGIFLTNNLSLIPPESYNDMLEIKRSEYALQSHLEFPQYAKENGVINNFYELKNSKTNITFFSVATSEGTVIQKRTVIINDGVPKTIQMRNEGYGYLLMYSEMSNMNTSTGMFPIWMQEFEYNNGMRKIVTNNIYKTGFPVWLIPETITQTNNSIVVTATGDYADLIVEWTLAPNDAEPKVKMTLNPKRNGYFSIGAFNGNEISRDKTEFVLNPFRIHSKRFTEEAVMVTEAFSSAALTQMTYYDDDNGIMVTRGLAADPESVPFRWVYSDSPKFGLITMGDKGGVRPALFAPVFGTEESYMESGSTFEFTYRPVTVEGGWYNGYIHTVNNIYNLTDYRINNESSLTQASFNMYRLLLNDWFSGWDNHAKAHYNMEGRNISTNADPLAYLQFYLLTEDKEMYERRTIPNLVNLLTRNAIHFRYDPEGEGSTSYFTCVGTQSDLGKGLQYGTATYTGAHKMTRGLVPRLRIEGGVDSGIPRFISGGQIGTVSLLSEIVWMYRYTNDEAYLESARAEAQKFMEEKVWAKQTVLPQEAPFINLSYFPYWSGLLDLYEVTNDIQYLEAAVEGARWHMTTIWTQPVVPDTDLYIDGERAWEFGNLRQGATLFWHGDKRYRVGVFNDFVPEGTYEQRLIEDKVIPAWVPSRVGLGIEQTTTFRGGRNSNIIMTTWAPDFLRLAKYTGDKDFETFARISQIGRYSNYPGYYQNSHDAYNISPEFPYVGPDFSSIYYHHIPILLSQVQDFLITQAWKWSNGHIEFPSVRQQGYVWFNSRHYGFEAGKFFGEDSMWLWLKEGLITLDNKQIDWIGARSDGKFGVALMNEDNADITVNIELGPEVYGNNSIKSAVIYAEDGSASMASVVNNTLTLLVPSKGLVAFVVEAPAVSRPNYAKVPFESFKYSDMSQTAVSVNVGGSPQRFVKGEVLQIDPDSYFAHVYVTHKSEDVSKVTLKYRIDTGIGIGIGDYIEEETSSYPFEFIIRVNEQDKNFEYNVDIYDTEGIKVADSVGGGILSPLYSQVDNENPLELLDYRFFDMSENEVYSPEGLERFVAKLSVRNITDNLIQPFKLVTSIYNREGRLEAVTITEKHSIEANEQSELIQEISVPNDFEGSIKIFAVSSMERLTPLLNYVLIPIIQNTQ